MSAKVVRVGLVGFGTIGSGVAKLILQEADSIAARTGRPIVPHNLWRKTADSVTQIWP
jgi:homoserine dehydrogenase